MNSYDLANRWVHKNVVPESPNLIEVRVLGRPTLITSNMDEVRHEMETWRRLLAEAINDALDEMVGHTDPSTGVEDAEKAVEKPKGAPALQGIRTRRFSGETARSVLEL